MNNSVSYEIQRGFGINDQKLRNDWQMKPQLVQVKLRKRTVLRGVIDVTIAHCLLINLNRIIRLCFAKKLHQATFKKLTQCAEVTSHQKKTSHSIYHFSQYLMVDYTIYSLQQLLHKRNPSTSNQKYITNDILFMRFLSFLLFNAPFRDISSPNSSPTSKIKKQLNILLSIEN